MSTDDNEDLRRAVSEILVENRSTTAWLGFDAALWRVLEETGLTSVGVSESAGGSGGSAHQGAIVVQAVGRHAAAVPVASGLLAGWLLDRAGLRLPPGPLAVATCSRGEHDLFGVPWAGVATHLVVFVDGEGVVLVPQHDFGVIHRGENLAGEPRDDVRLADLPTAVPVPPGTRAQLRIRAAALTVAAMAGAFEGLLDVVRRQVTERTQFGRPLAKFQAVQQYVARVAAESAGMVAVADAVGKAIDGPDAGFAVMAGKAAASAAVSDTVALAHQVVGAIGVTEEHELHRLTTRLWSWREEDGTEPELELALGRLALAPDGIGPWALVVS